MNKYVKNTLISVGAVIIAAILFCISAELLLGAGV